MTTVTSRRRARAYVQTMTTGDFPRPEGVGSMFWHKSATFALDCIAVAAGLAIATPFVLILTSPFIAGF